MFFHDSVVTSDAEKYQNKILNINDNQYDI